jgi:hypothetical protein
MRSSLLNRNSLLASLLILTGIGMNISAASAGSGIERTPESIVANCAFRKGVPTPAQVLKQLNGGTVRNGKNSVTVLPCPSSSFKFQGKDFLSWSENGAVIAASLTQTQEGQLLETFRYQTVGTGKNARNVMTPISYNIPSATPQILYRSLIQEAVKNKQPIDLSLFSYQGAISGNTVRNNAITISDDRVSLTDAYARKFNSFNVLMAKNRKGGAGKFFVKDSNGSGKVYKVTKVNDSQTLFEAWYVTDKQGTLQKVVPTAYDMAVAGWVFGGRINWQ